MEKVALFDFCGTITNFQTADAYINYTAKLYPSLALYFRDFCYKVLLKAGVVRFLTERFPKSSINKRMILWKTRGLSRRKMEESARRFYLEEIKPNFIEETTNILQSLQAEGYRIVIVSGGYDIYLKYFAIDFGITDVISTRIAFRNNRCIGCFDGVDCMWEEKTRLLDCRFGHSDIRSVAFSDSISDLPMMQWADEAYVVSRKGGPSWASKYGFEEIVY